MYCRIILARECAAILLDRQHELAVCKFVEILGSKVSAVIASSLGSVCSHSKQREKMWTAFHEFRSSDLGMLWRSLLVELSLPGKFKDPWLIQVVSRLFLEKLVALKHPLPPSSGTSDHTKHLSVDEHNALRYAAGYVFFSLKRKYASNPLLLSWIKQQSDADNNVCDPDNLGDSVNFSNFTKVWVNKVNRGGLFIVSDCAYEVFHAMEQVLRQFLSSIPDNKHLDKDRIISILLEDSSIQFYWSMMAFDFDTNTAQNVLQDVIKLWITIRGHSYASAIVEEYKRLNGALKRTKSLRKELKKQSTDISE